MATPPTFKMTLSLGIIDHLGLNLYSNVPAVVSELVANAWDADARHVSIQFDNRAGTILVEDDGFGMTVSDVNGKFLNVGYRKREAESPITPELNRHVMGRKGIGKLSIFSIADEVEIHTAKLMNDGQVATCGFVMRTDDIRTAIGPRGAGDYFPEEVPNKNITLSKGTRLKLRNLKKRVTSATINALRKRLARRFSIIGTEHKFEVSIDGRPVGVEDRDYFRNIEYLWSIGGVNNKYKSLATKAQKSEHISGQLAPQDLLDKEEIVELETKVPSGFSAYEVTGWVGTFDEQANIEEGNNSIVVLAWGKLIHEDILKEINVSGLYAKYLIGELRADFLDTDHAEDIITSNRQALREDDPRAVLFRRWLQKKVLATIQNRWRDWRRERAMDRAKENPAVKEWYDSLTSTNRDFAKKLFGKIGSLPIEEEEARRQLYRHAILAFERLQMQDRLNEIESLPDGAEIGPLMTLVQTLDDLEAAHYHQIAQGRLDVINRFEAIVDANAKEKVVQEFLFDHLWLLDPSWERGTLPEAHLEKAIGSIFDADKAGLSDEQRRARLDLQLRTAPGRYVIIELKRYDVQTQAFDLLQQVKKYRDAVKQCLDRFRNRQGVEVILVLGMPPQGMTVEDFESYLAVEGTRWITYDQLITGAQAAYREYLQAHKNLSRITELLGKL